MSKGVKNRNKKKLMNLNNVRFWKFLARQDNLDLVKSKQGF